MKTTLSELHHQAMDWMRELDFYHQEIQLLQKRLEEFAAKNTHTEIKSQYEDFRKQFNSLQKSIVDMQNDVSIRETVVEKMTEENKEKEPVDVSMPEDLTLKRMKDLVHEIADTRFFFNLFLSRQK